MINIFLLNTQNLNISDIPYSITRTFNSKKRGLEWKASRWLRDYVLSHYYDIPPEKLYFQTNTSGKPSLANYDNLHFSISHSGNIVVIVLSEYQIGIDIQKIRNDKNNNISNIIKKYYFEEERNIIERSKDKIHMFYKFWVLKESLIKAKGESLGIGLRKYGFIVKNSKIDVIFNNSNFNFGCYQYEDYFFAITSIASQKKLKVREVTLNQNSFVLNIRRLFYS